MYQVGGEEDCSCRQVDEDTASTDMHLLGVGPQNAKGHATWRAEGQLKGKLAVAGTSPQNQGSCK